MGTLCNGAHGVASAARRLAANRIICRVCSSTAGAATPSRVSVDHPDWLIGQTPLALQHPHHGGIHLSGIGAPADLLLQALLDQCINFYWTFLRNLNVSKVCHTWIIQHSVDNKLVDVQTMQGS